MTDLTAASEASSIHKLAVETDTALAPLWNTEFRYYVYAVNEAKRVAEGSRFASEEKVAEYEAKRAEARAEAAPLEDVYATYRWSRFFLVTNSNGHIHSSRVCSTCRWDTEFAWLPDMSGLTEVEAVEAYGEILCSVCFPSAPAEWTNGESKAKKAERAEREAKKAAKAAKKAEKALFADDVDKGIRGAHDTIKTIAAAKSYLTDAYSWGLDHPSYTPETVEAVAAALAERTNDTPKNVLTMAEIRAAKRGW